MPKHNTNSSNNLKSCIKPLRDLFSKVVSNYDNSITCGLRDEETQRKAKRNNVSKVDFPNSKHNGLPPKFDESWAVDAVPYPIPEGWGEVNATARSEVILQWKERVKFYEFAAIIRYEWIKMQTSDKSLLKYKLTWGGDWDGDGDYRDNNFDDLVHFQLTLIKEEVHAPKHKEEKDKVE